MNDTDHKIRVVAEWAGMWKPNQQALNHSGWHENPPPNLLEPAGAWALLVALWRRRWFLCPKQIHGRDDHYVELTQDFGVPTVAFPSSNWVFNDSYDLTPEQLLDLAYQLATKEQR